MKQGREFLYPFQITVGINFHLFQNSSDSFLKVNCSVESEIFIILCTYKEMSVKANDTMKTVQDRRALKGAWK